MIQLKSKKQIDLMRIAGKALAKWMRSVIDQMASKEYEYWPDGKSIERWYYQYLKTLGEDYDSVFDKVKDYGSPICVSINDEIVHSRPTKKPFELGDIITIDAGLSYKGWMADMARTIVYGGAEGLDKVDNGPRGDVFCLLESTLMALEAGQKQCKPGNKISDISAAIAEEARTYGLGVVTKFGGHGIGRDIHEDPHIPNDPSLVWKDAVLRKGMVFCIEPMLTLGTGEVVMDSDRWRVFSLDGSLAAHQENMIAITDNGYEILTRTEE